MTFARDAASGGDRVAAEAYFQHAEHYYRILNDSTDPRSESQQQQARQQRGNGRDQRDGQGQGGEQSGRVSDQPAAAPDGHGSEGNGQTLADAPQPESPPEAFGLPSGEAEAPRSELEGVGFLQTDPSAAVDPGTADQAADAPAARPRRGRAPKRQAADGEAAAPKQRRGRPPKTARDDEAGSAVEEGSDSGNEPVSP